MIIIGEGVVNPLYTRVTVTRAYMQAEIAIHSKILANPIQPSSTLYVGKYGKFYVDNLIQQGENIILQAFDPLAYYTKYRLATVFTTTEHSWRSSTNRRALGVMYDFLAAQTNATDLDRLDITLNAPDEDGGELAVVDARYDCLFDVYTKIPESYDPSCRMDITPVASMAGNTIYKPKLGNDTPLRIETPYVVDYAQHASFPTQAIVLGYERTETTVGEGDRQIFVNAPLTKGQYFLTEEGNNALAEAKAGAANITVRMLEKYLPNIKPADSILLGDDPYTVYSIEHTTSPQGEWVYLACGGRVMSVADRINALIAADYAARY